MYLTRYPRCGVDVDHDSQTLNLTTTLCPDPCDCDSCDLPTAQCEIPALGAGLWDVVVNDHPAFRLPISYEREIPPPRCASYAAEELCGPVGSTAGSGEASHENGATCPRPQTPPSGVISPPADDGRPEPPPNRI